MLDSVLLVSTCREKNDRAARAVVVGSSRTTDAAATLAPTVTRSAALCFSYLWQAAQKHNE